MMTRNTVMWIRTDEGFWSSGTTFPGKTFKEDMELRKEFYDSWEEKDYRLFFPVGVDPNDLIEKQKKEAKAEAEGREIRETLRTRLRAKMGTECCAWSGSRHAQLPTTSGDGPQKARCASDG